MQDLRKVHQVANPGPGLPKMNHSIKINYASFWSGKIGWLNSSRQPFDGISLRGYIQTSKSITSVQKIHVVLMSQSRTMGDHHPPFCVSSSQTYKAFLEGDHILQDLAPWMGAFRCQMRCTSTEHGRYPWDNEKPILQSQGPLMSESEVSRTELTVKSSPPTQWKSGTQHTYELSALELKKSIRLLALFPGSYADPLVCELLETSLRDNPS
jgi:hypothetical protein